MNRRKRRGRSKFRKLVTAPFRGIWESLGFVFNAIRGKEADPWSSPEAMREERHKQRRALERASEMADRPLRAKPDSTVHNHLLEANRRAAEKAAEERAKIKAENERLERERLEHELENATAAFRNSMSPTNPGSGAGSSYETTDESRPIRKSR